MPWHSPDRHRLVTALDAPTHDLFECIVGQKKACPPRKRIPLDARRAGTPRPAVPGQPGRDCRATSHPPARRGREERARAVAQVAAVGQDDRNTAEYPDSGLKAGIDEPLPGAEESARIGNRPGVEERSYLDMEKRPFVEGLLELGVEEEVATAERSPALPTLGCPAVPPQP